MNAVQTAYRLRVLFEQKITAEYFNSFKGHFGRVQVEVLSYLYEREHARVQELANALNIPKQHASKIMIRLEEQNLVCKQSDPNDKRSTLFFLSDDGIQLMEKHLAVSNDAFGERMEKLSADEQQKLISSMELLTSMLERF